MPGTRNNEGFSLIELLVVVMIINLLAAAAITLYVGIRDKARRGSMTSIAIGARTDLQHWLQSSFSPKREIIEVDTNFSGVVEDGDSANGELLNNVAVLYAAGRNTVLGEISPWFSTPLWTANDPPPPGTISLTQPAPNQVRVMALGKNGEVLAQYIVSIN